MGICGERGIFQSFSIVWVLPMFEQDQIDVEVGLAVKDLLEGL